MNCEDFDKIINELADYQPIEATLRDASVSHVALCPDCAAKLANARAVGACLLVAARAESEDAPVRVKENLLAAFAGHQQTKAAPARVVDIASRRRPRVWIAAAAAVAAVILLAMLVPVWKKALAPGAHESVLAPRTIDNAPVIPVRGTQVETIRPVAKTGPTKPRQLKHSRTEPESPKQAVENVAQNTGEFLPLTYLATATAMESGTIVRVELSRAALTSLGFPVNVEGSSASVKAEVILGDDGVARAIRLVQ